MFTESTALPNKRVVIFGSANSVHVQRWVRGLTERGWSIRLISKGDLQLTDIETVALPGTGRLAYFRLASAAADAARTFRPDLVHVHYAGGYGLWGIRANIRPLLVSVWGSDLIGHWPRRLYRAMPRYILRRATHITATSQFLYRMVCQHLPNANKKTTIIPFGITLSGEPAPPPSGGVKLIYLKAHRSIYGPQVLLNAMVEVRKVHPEVTLTLAGEGEITPRLKRLTADLDLVEAVRFVGFIPNADVPSRLRNHNIMVMPSLSESFGVAALEASACARPVIASDVGGIPEVVQHGVTGLLVPPGNPGALAEAILKLIDDPTACERMGRAGYEYVKSTYPWEKSLDDMSALYERLIHDHNSKA